MNTRTLSPGDLAAGQHITVLDVIEPEKEYSGSSAVMVIDPSRQPQDWRGIAFEVLVVDLPFVLLDLPAGSGRVSLDTRRFQFMELKPEYWQAVHRPHRPLPAFEQLVQNSFQSFDQRLRTLEQRPQPAPPKPWWKRIFSHA